MKSVLFVSHDADLRAVAARVLQRAGFRVRAVEHGGHALLALVECGGIDVLVIEDALPEGPGAEIAARVRRHCPNVHVVRMCDRGEVPDRMARAGTEGTAVVRPFTADDLIEAVQTLRRTISR